MRLGLVALLVLLAGLPAQARDLRVSDGETLSAALSSAKAGDAVLLGPGEYGTLKLIGFAPDGRGPVRIASADPNRKAVFTGLQMTGVQDVTLANLVFDYRFPDGGKSYKDRPFEIMKSSGITIEGSVFDGDRARGTNSPADGYGAGFALSIRKSQDIAVRGSDFRNFYRGIAVGETKNVTIARNNVQEMRSDGMTFVKVSDLLIEQNHIHDFARNLDAGDHADMIQFWSRNAHFPSTGVTIRGNVLNMGGGQHTQSIFIRNEAVDSQNGGRKMFYRDFLIEENVIINGHLHGITVGETDGLTIRQNTLIRTPRKGDWPERGRPGWVPRIRVKEGSVNVTITGNIVLSVPEAMPGWTVRNNLLIQDTSMMAPHHYNTVFANGLASPPYRLEDFFYIPGSSAAIDRLGAARLAPGRQ